MNEVEQLLAQGQKIAAIKLYREQTGVGLKEAKDYVDALSGSIHPLPVATPGESPHREKQYSGPEIETKRGGKWIAVVLIIILAAAAFILLRNLT